MKNRIIFKSIVTGILSASLVLESIFPAFGVNIDKEAITRMLLERRMGAL